MKRTLPALIVAGSLLATATPVAAEGRKAAIGVSVRVVSACAVAQPVGKTIGVRCTRGGADRVMVTTPAPRVIALISDGSRLRGDVPVQHDIDRSQSADDAVITLQF